MFIHCLWQPGKPKLIELATVNMSNRDVMVCGMGKLCHSGIVWDTRILIHRIIWNMILLDFLSLVFLKVRLCHDVNGSIPQWCPIDSRDNLEKTDYLVDIHVAWHTFPLYIENDIRTVQDIALIIFRYQNLEHYFNMHYTLHSIYTIIAMRLTQRYTYTHVSVN